MMSRQAPPAHRFRLAPPPTSSSSFGSKNKRKSGSGGGGCKPSIFLLLVIILFVVMIAVLLPSRFLNLPTDKDHPMMNLRRSQQMLYQGLHQLEALEATTEKEIYKNLQIVEQVAEKGLHKLEEAAEKWANGSSTGMDGLDAGSVDWPNHVYPVDSIKSKTSVTTSSSSSLPSIKIATHVTPIIKSNRRRIAYAITITKDGFFQDGAAILAYSILNVSRNSPFDISLIAFVHPNVTTSRPSLQRLGYHVIEAPKPINVSAISRNFTFLRDKIDKNGTEMYGNILSPPFQLNLFPMLLHQN